MKQVHHSGGNTFFRTLTTRVLTAAIVLLFMLQPVAAQQNSSSAPVLKQLLPAGGGTDLQPVEPAADNGFPYGIDPAKEDISKRSYTAKQFRNDDGTYTGIFSSGVLHYKANGKFLDINPDIVANTNGVYVADYPYINATNLMQSYFSANASGGLMSVSKEGKVKEFMNTRLYWVKNGSETGTVQSANAPATVNGAKLTYGNLYPKIDAEYIISAGKRELNYVIHSPAALSAAPAGAEYLVFSEEVEMEDNWSYTVTPKGVDLIDATGTKIYRFSNPFAVEAYGTQNEQRTTPADNPTMMEVTANGNILTVLTKVKADWLLDSQRIFPIAIDPTANYYPDNTVDWSGAAWSDGYGQDITIATGRSGGYYVTGFFRINLSSFPVGGTVTSATANIYRYTGNALAAYQWTYANCMDPLTASTYYDIFASVTTAYCAANLTGLNTNGWKTGTMNASGLSAIVSGISAGFVAMTAHPQGTWVNGRTASFYGYSNATYKPYLAITYTISSCVAGTASPSYKYVPTNGTASLSLSGYNNATTFQWEYSPNGSSGWTNASGGSGATTPNYTTGTLANGDYYYRVKITDGGSCTDYSNVVHVNVAATPPAPCSGAGSGSPVVNNHIDDILFHEFDAPGNGYRSGNYYDYSDTSTYGKATVVAGQYHHFGIALRANGTGAASSTIAVWIDFNQDGVFDNTPFSSGGELIDLQNFTSTVGNTYAAYLTIPSWASGLVKARARLLRGNFASIDPCGSYTNSQTMDFSVLIRPSIGSKPCGDVNGSANVVLANNTADLVYISRVQVDGPWGTEIDKSGNFFGVYSGGTTTMYNYTNNMGSYSNGLTFESGQSYTVTVEHSGYNSVAGVFVDWNGDGDFDDANEICGRTASTVLNPYIFTFTAPTGLTNGKEVVMRVRLRYDDVSAFGNTLTGCNNITSDGLQKYSEVEDYRATLLSPPLVCAPVANLAAVIGTPANGAAHHLTVSWDVMSGATGYHVEYSTDGVTFGNQVTSPTATYDFNAGNNPNKPYWFRVRATDGSQTCAWTTMSTPVYTACDDPATPTLSNVTASSITVAITPETPVQNPAITTYSIYCTTEGKYVQANGTLGNTEVFQTAAAWGSTVVSGLSLSTNYCFNAKAKNNDGDTRGGTVGILTTETFSSDNINNNSTPPTSVWGSPNTCGAGSWFDFNATAGCGGGGAKYTATTDNFYLGCFLRSPYVNCTGQSTVTFSFDITNHLDAGDNINFSCWSIGDNKYSGSTLTINGVANTSLPFNVARNCERITVVYSLSGFTNKSQLLFYINNNGDNDFGTYNLVIDNFSINADAPTACATTLSCMPPAFTVNSTAICNGESAALTVNCTNNCAGATYTWAPATGLNVTTGTSVTANPTSTVTYTITGTDGICNVTANSTLTVHPVIADNTIDIPSAICNGKTPATLNGSTPTGGTGSYIYLWESSTVDAYSGFATAQGISGNKNYSPAALSQTTWFRRTVTSGACTSTSAAVQITVYPTPTVNVTAGGSTTICSESSITLNASGAATYSWEPYSTLSSNAGASVEATPTTTPGVTITTTYTVTGTSTDGCTNTASITVTTKPQPVVTPTPISAVCTGQITATLSASVSDGSYTWSPNLYVTSTNGLTDVPITVETSQLMFYTVTGTGVNGCSKGVVVPVATVSVGGNISPLHSIICSGGSKQLTVTGAAGNSYQWQSSPSGTSNWTDIAGQTNLTYTASPVVTTYYRLMAQSNACWNVASTTAEVEISNPSITVSVTKRTDHAITLDWSPTGSGNYTVSYNGTTSGSASNTTPPYTLSGLTANGTYNITVTQTGVAGCSASGDTSAVTTLCAMPTNVTVSSPSSKKLKVDWEGAAGNYRVYYRPMRIQNVYQTKDVTTAGTSGSTTINVTYNTSYEVYVVSKDCPSSGQFGQPSALYYGIVGASSPCTPTPAVHYVKSTCAGQIEVSMSGSPTGNYSVAVQRLTPTVASMYIYSVSGSYFQVNVGSAGETFLVAVASKCASGTSDYVIYQGGITIKPLCNAVPNLVLSNPFCNGFTASWNRDVCAENTVNTYQLFLRRTSPSPQLTWSSYNVVSPNAPITPYKLVSWMNKGSVIQCYVRSNYVCNGYVIQGPPSTTESITTLSAGCREEEEALIQPEEPTAVITSADNSEAISLYPNPNGGQFRLDISRLSNEKAEVKIEVMNVLGQTVLTSISEAKDGFGNELITLPETVSAGTYFVRVTVGNNVYAAKVSVNK